MPYRTIDLCAGIGGIRKGFEMTGHFMNVLSSEIDKHACATYEHLYGENSQHDLTTEEFKQLIEQTPYDVLLAGFPCQAFSIGGQQDGFKDKRGVMFFEVARIVQSCRPKIVFLENVENLLEHDGGRTFLVIYNILAQCGYAVRYRVMSTYEYENIPQARKRIYIVAFRDYSLCDLFRYPEPIELKQKISDVINRAERKNEIYYYIPGTDMYERLNLFIRDSKEIFRVYNGQVRSVRNPAICPTITASMNSVYNAIILRDPFGIRRLTLRETLDFQGFPANYYFPKTVSLADAYRQIGNSVSVPVIKRIAQNIVDLL